MQANRIFTRRNLLRLGLVGTGGTALAVLAACGETQVVERVVTKEVVVEKIVKEEVPVEVEKIVAREVEKIVTREVEVEKIVTKIVEVPAATTEAPKPQPSGPVTISWWENEMIPGWRELTAEFVAEFEEENPNITVDWTITDWGDYYEKALTAAGAGQLPDIWMTNYSQNAEFINLGLVHPINEFLQPAFANQFFPAMLEMGVKRGDKLYGLVNGSATRGFYYNTELFEAAGIMGPPETYDEMIDGAVKIGQLPDKWGYVLQTKGEQGDQDFIWRHWSNGGDLITADRKPAIANESGYDAMQFMLDMVDAGATQPNVADTDYQQKIDIFMAGNSGMMIGGSWWQANLITGTLPWATAPIPKTNLAFNQLVTNDYLMSAESKNKEAAWKLMEKTADDKWALARDRKMYLTAFKRTYAHDPFFTTPGWAAFFRNLENTRFMPGDVPKWVAMQEEMRAQIQLVMLGEKSATAGVDDASSQWEKLLEDS